jgi:hypothetical protein
MTMYFTDDSLLSENQDPLVITAAHFATGITPAMAGKMIGAGSQYAIAFRDSKGKFFNGGKTYRLRLPPNIPAKNFLSIILYDNQTRSMLHSSCVSGARKKARKR